MQPHAGKHRILARGLAWLVIAQLGGKPQISGQGHLIEGLDALLFAQVVDTHSLLPDTRRCQAEVPFDRSPAEFLPRVSLER